MLLFAVVVAVEKIEVGDPVPLSHYAHLRATPKAERSAFIPPPIKHPAVDYEMSLRDPENPRFLSGQLSRLTSNFNIFFSDDVPADIRLAFTFATDVLSTFFNFQTKIGVRVSMKALGQRTTLAFASATGLAYIDGTVLGPVSLCKVLKHAGDPSCQSSSGVIDVNVVVNSDVLNQLYTGIDAAPPPNQFDFVTIALHEVCHGLGIISRIGESGEILDTSGGVPVPYIFDTLLTLGGVAYSTSTPASSLASAITSGNCEIRIPSVVSPPPYGGQSIPAQPPIKIFCPSSYIAGSSMSHLDTNTYKGKGNPPVNSMMVHQLDPGTATHILGPNVFNIFKAMGYPMRDCVDQKTCSGCIENGCQWCFYGGKGMPYGFCGDFFNKPYQGICLNDRMGWLTRVGDCRADGSTVGAQTTAAVTTSVAASTATSVATALTGSLSGFIGGIVSAASPLHVPLWSNLI